MKRLVCRYPGDPPIEVLEMDQKEFLYFFPRTPTVMRSQQPDGTWVEEVIATPSTPFEILCDSCSAPYDDPSGLEKIYVYHRNHGRCAKCYKEGLEEYCTVAKNQRLDSPLR